MPYSVYNKAEVPAHPRKVVSNKVNAPERDFILAHITLQSNLFIYILNLSGNWLVMPSAHESAIMSA